MSTTADVTAQFFSFNAFSVSSNRSSPRATQITLAPAKARAAAAPWPIPDDAPVISAVFPSRDIDGISGSFIISTPTLTNA